MMSLFFLVTLHEFNGEKMNEIFLPLKHLLMPYVMAAGELTILDTLGLGVGTS